MKLDPVRKKGLALVEAVRDTVLPLVSMRRGTIIRSREGQVGIATGFNRLSAESGRTSSGDAGELSADSPDEVQSMVEVLLIGGRLRPGDGLGDVLYNLDDAWQRW